MLNHRISATLEHHQPKEQAGFRNFRVSNRRISRATKTLSIAFIDYQKAFDTVSFESIWKTLNHKM